MPITLKSKGANSKMGKITHWWNATVLSLFKKWFKHGHSCLILVFFFLSWDVTTSSAASASQDPMS